MNKLNNLMSANGEWEKQYREQVKPYLKDNEEFIFELPSIRESNMTIEEFKELFEEYKDNEEFEEFECNTIHYFNVVNFLKIMYNQYWSNNNFDITILFELLEAYMNVKYDEKNYCIEKLNDEAIELLNLKFLYFKNNHTFKYSEYSSFFMKKTVYFDNFKESVYILSIVVNDSINTYILFNKNKVSIEFKKFLFLVLKLNYNDILRKNNTFSNKEKELLNNLDFYSICGMREKYEFDYKSHYDKSFKIVIEAIDYYERELLTLEQRFKKLCKFPIKRKTKPFSSYEVKNYAKSLKNNKEVQEYYLDKLDSLYESFYHYLRYETKYEEQMFNNLMLQTNDDFEEYDNFEYSTKEKELFYFK